MKSDMLTSLYRRYRDVESNVLLVLATLLDPRFKHKFFSEADRWANAKQLLNQKVAELSHTEEPTKPSPKAGLEADSSYSTVANKYLSEPMIPFHRGNLQLVGKKQTSLSTPCHFSYEVSVSTSNLCPF